MKLFWKTREYSEQLALFLSETARADSSQHTLRAEVQGNDFIFYLDNKRIGRLQDNRSSKGSVGLLVEYVLSVLFDKFWVSGPGIPSGAHGTAAVESWGRTKSSFSIRSKDLKLNVWCKLLHDI
jgi:hypothetical protein